MHSGSLCLARCNARSKMEAVFIDFRRICFPVRRTMLPPLIGNIQMPDARQGDIVLTVTLHAIYILTLRPFLYKFQVSQKTSQHLPCPRDLMLKCRILRSGFCPCRQCLIRLTHSRKYISLRDLLPQMSAQSALNCVRITI